MTRSEHVRSLLAFSLLAFFVPFSLPSTRAQDATAPHSDPYKKWLEEDVRWIISDQERSDFKKLATDEQRNNFVLAFWNRRNPAPGKAENAFKEEHYRRLAFANQHFAQGIPGWKTDRGRFYIMYGPPDKVIHHLNSDLQPDGIRKGRFDSEEWHWTYIDGLGCNVILEFEHTCGCGEYHLTRAENGVGHQEHGVTPLRQLGPDCLIDQILFP